jgi:photosystem II stability/assembly factor-like uncharacterized protein
MKKLILLCILTFMISQMTFSQEYGWTDISENLPDTLGYDLWGLSDVFFVSDNEGWISVSSDAIILHTTDGGETFEIQYNEFSTTLEAICMIDENEGYTGGASGFVYRTIDGGENWNFHGTISSTLTDIDFASQTQGYCCGDNGTVYSITSDGVENLNSGLSTSLDGISAPSVIKVWVCGGANIVYYNGSTFTFQSGQVGTYNSIFFINEDEGWVVGNNGLIGHTVNGGDSWTPQTNPENKSLYKVFFLDETTGWAVGFNGIILSTTNGGETWNVEGEVLTTNFLRGIHFTSPSNGYAVGNEKTLLKYTELSGTSDLPQPGKQQN